MWPCHDEYGVMVHPFVRIQVLDMWRIVNGLWRKRPVLAVGWIDVSRFLSPAFAWKLDD